MKRLKIILLFSYILITIYSINTIINFKVKEGNVDDNYKIISIKEEENYTKLIVKNKEKYILYTDSKNYKIGDTLKIKGKKVIPSKNTNFYTFNYQNYLRGEKIFYKIIPEEIALINTNKNIIYKIKNALFNRMNKFKNKEYFYLFIYGENNLDSDIYENIKNIGIAHLLALSGMHVSFIILPFRKLKRKRIIIPLILMSYLIIVKPSVSILRAALLEIIYQITNFKRKNILVFLFFLFLLYNPFFIYNLGFKLSFITSYILNSNKSTYFKEILNTSISATLINMPICINAFFHINFLTPLYNLFYVPFISFVLFPSIIITFVIDSLEPLLNIEINILETSIEFISKIKMLDINFGYLNLIPFIILYIFILIFLKYKKHLILIMLFLLIHYNISYFNQSLKITILDVNQGDSILIETPNNSEAIMIDTGGEINKNLTKKVLLNSLYSRSIHKIKYLILTHGDYDHMGEAVNLVNNFKVENVIFNCGDYNNLEKELIKTLENKNIKYYSCIKELNIDNYKLQFLNTKKYDNENENSSVIYLNYNNYKFLFMGDAGIPREKDILEKYNLSNINFIKIGHHGSNTSSSKNFINSINPKYSLISVGKNNRYGHPKESVLDILSNSKIFRTDLDGSIEIKLNKSIYKIRMRPP